ncbi:hypothetical protein J5N97_001843 [Dioscorea zingiberensis]|uniref:SHSP domain-containing protein n=1 Tax=Dioscorea zingiberensis TaxID=325984 RepID=A0A9D5BTJ0_9LILI|nr:hypothetical protein J5N97_001843 [Dioscorea zingiberensis]
MALMARFCMRSRRSRSCLLHGGPLYNGLYMGNAADVKGLEEARSMCTQQPPSLTYYSTDTRDRAVPDNRGEMISAKPSDTPTRRGGRGRGRRGLLWSNPWELVPWGRNHGGGGHGNALEHMSGSLNRLFQNLMPSRILGRLKEDDARYKLQYEVPGLRKEDLKITVENSFLTISGEHKEEEEDEGEGSDDEDGWHASRYRFYHTTLMLPSDAKVDEIKAELKHGVLHITIPRSEDRKSDVRTIDIQ